MAYVAKWIDESQHSRFNNFLAKAGKGHVLQSWEWGEIKSRTGWRPWRLVVEEEGEIVAVVSLLERKIPVVGIPIFYASRGPVLDLGNVKLFDMVLGEIRKLAKTRGAIFLKIDPDVPSS
ncbi:MAG: peptidoglycan bridge formation glycyltransferase FemA/FemB family protein, partial [Bacillota bacterium]|nr:peptidoglycan bridge formation glycyltransferase FemA/FemB family protein [Bacillota bacterium]